MLRNWWCRRLRTSSDTRTKNTLTGIRTGPRSGLLSSTAFSPQAEPGQVRYCTWIQPDWHLRFPVWHRPSQAQTGSDSTNGPLSTQTSRMFTSAHTPSVAPLVRMRLPDRPASQTLLGLSSISIGAPWTPCLSEKFLAVKELIFLYPQSPLPSSPPLTRDNPTPEDELTEEVWYCFPWCLLHLMGPLFLVTLGILESLPQMPRTLPAILCTLTGTVGI